MLTRSRPFPVPYDIYGLHDCHFIFMVDVVHVQVAVFKVELPNLRLLLDDQEIRDTVKTKDGGNYWRVCCMVQELAIATPVRRRKKFSGFMHDMPVYWIAAGTENWRFIGGSRYRTAMTAGRKAYVRKKTLLTGVQSAIHMHFNNTFLFNSLTPSQRKAVAEYRGRRDKLKALGDIIGHSFSTRWVRN